MPDHNKITPHAFHSSNQGLSKTEVCALALVLKARGMAQNTGLTVKVQHHNGHTMQILMNGPCAALKNGPTKTSFEKLLSLSEEATFIAKHDTIEITLQFDLTQIEKSSAANKQP